MALRRLQATPDQEQVIREELDKLFAAFREHREEWGASRHDLAEAIRDESFDATTMGELFGRHDERLEQLRKALMEAMGRIHAVLDDTQRQRLAEMIDRGRGGWHPFRGGMA
ncbi:MAG: periplasmic heavy metal sensor [Myxococcales bacterium]|nr:periplasmic heavy metal sensor [Myxococcales bacterium]